MSLSQLALRLSAVAALTAGSPARWPTSARHRVYESDIPAQAATDPDASLPIILVFTDSAEVERIGSEPDILDGDETVALAFEVMVPVAISGDDGLRIEPSAASDQIAEAMLDLISEQIRQAVAHARMEGPIRHVLVSVNKVDRRGWQDADSGMRLSAARIEYTCRVRRCLPWQQTGDGLAALPEPFRSVAEELPPGTYGRTIADTVAATISAPDAFVALQELRFASRLARAAGEVVPPRDPAAAPRPLGDVGGSIDTAP
jgi:hypothetical protein